jgi:hypothetical protein
METGNWKTAGNRDNCVKRFLRNRFKGSVRNSYINHTCEIYVEAGIWNGTRIMDIV